MCYESKNIDFLHFDEQTVYNRKPVLERIARNTRISRVSNHHDTSDFSRCNSRAGCDIWAAFTESNVHVLITASAGGDACRDVVAMIVVVTMGWDIVGIWRIIVVVRLG